MSTDPICGTAVDPEAAEQAGLSCTYGGATFYFCSTRCLREFLQLPSLYAVFGENDDEQQYMPPAS